MPGVRRGRGGKADPFRKVQRNILKKVVLREQNKTQTELVKKQALHRLFFSSYQHFACITSSCESGTRPNVAGQEENSQGETSVVKETELFSLSREAEKR